MINTREQVDRLIEAGVSKEQAITAISLLIRRGLPIVPWVDAALIARGKKLRIEEVEFDNPFTGE